jgi:hypothetical protein
MNTREYIKSMIIGTPVRTRFIALTVAVFSSIFTMAQVKFTTVISSREIGRGDYVQVEFVVENASQIDYLTPPSFPNFKVVEGPIQSSGMSIVNGNTSQYKGVSFVLQPLKTGRFTITGATANVDGKSMHSNPVTVEVNANGPAPGVPSSVRPGWPDEPSEADREYVLRPGENITEKIKKNLFVKVQADKTTCFIGEPIVVTYKLYSRLRSESRVIKRPSLNGFSVYDMIDPNTDVASVETLNGKQFAVHIIRKAQLIPLQAGTVDLDPAEVENKVYFIKQSSDAHRRGSLADDIFGQYPEDGTETDQNITLQSQPLAITIKPLPEANKPADFNGAVGHFTIEAGIENKKIAARDAATLKVIVRGNGNLPIVNAPQIKWPDSVEAYDATAKEEVDKTVAPLSGSKTFEYLFSPQKKGSYILPAVDFSYFDPTSASYKTVSSGPFNFEVATAAKQKKFSFASKEEVSSSLKTFLQKHLEWFFALLILSGLAIYLWRQNTRLRKADLQLKAAAALIQTPVENTIPAHLPGPVDPLSRAKRLLANADYTGFYRELNQAIWDTLRDELHLPSSELNKYNIRRQLKIKGWDEATIASLENTLNECEMNLYTPDHNEKNMQHILENAEMIIKYLRES